MNLLHVYESIFVLANTALEYIQLCNEGNELRDYPSLPKSVLDPPTSSL